MARGFVSLKGTWYNCGDHIGMTLCLFGGCGEEVSYLEGEEPRARYPRISCLRAPVATQYSEACTERRFLALEVQAHVLILTLFFSAVGTRVLQCEMLTQR
jgi:hypothetical protein